VTIVVFFTFLVKWKWVLLSS